VFESSTSVSAPLLQVLSVASAPGSCPHQRKVACGSSSTASRSPDTSRLQQLVAMVATGLNSWQRSAVAMRFEGFVRAAGPRCRHRRALSARRASVRAGAARRETAEVARSSMILHRQQLLHHFIGHRGHLRTRLQPR
jgi:hypothetical protein